MKLLAVLIVGASLVGPSVQARKRPKPCSHGDAIERKHCKSHRLCSNARPRWCVENAIVHGRRWLQPWQKAWMRRVPGCESGWNPLAYFGHPHNRRPTSVIYVKPEKSAGLYEYKASTWRSTPYGGRSIWLARYQALATLWMVKVGRTGEWACS